MKSKLWLLVGVVGFGVVLHGATKCVSAGWPVAESVKMADVEVTLSSGGAAASSAIAVETRFKTCDWADDFPLWTRPLKGMVLILR